MGTGLNRRSHIFGGKSRIASLVWERFGKVENFVEPFFGSGAVLLGCPWPGHTETVNDADALLANFWRSIAADPIAVAAAADWPVNEVDLHARHRFLRDRRGWVEELMTDPEAYDAKLAGWWVWGISQWIGSGWCPLVGAASAKMPHLGDDGMDAHAVVTQDFDHKQTTKDGQVWRKRPQLSDNRGVQRDSRGVQRELPRKRPVVAGTGSQTHRGLGVHRASLHEGAQVRNLPRQVPHLGDAGLGPHRPAHGQLPHLSGDSGAAGQGIHASAFEARTGGLYVYFEALAARLRRVRVCCGDWRRVTGPSVTFRHGLTAVFLDPPYLHDGRADVYAYEHQVFEDVRQWAIENGDNPMLRIALCGYDFEMPEGWKQVRWKAHGGYGSQGNGRGRENAEREMVWFSPHCIDPSEQARDALSRPIAVRESDWSGTMFDEVDDAA